MQLKDFPLTITVAACITGAALVANVFAGPKERPKAIDLGELQAADEERFAAADADGDGLVSAEEFAAVDPRRMSAGFRGQGDRDGSRRGRSAGQRHNVESEAIRERMAERRAERQAAMEERQQAARAREFETGDADGDGQLSVEEYGDIPASMKATRQRQLFARLDVNADGMLTPEEFPSALGRLQPLDADSDGIVTREEMQAGRDRAEKRAGRDR